MGLFQLKEQFLFLFLVKKQRCVPVQESLVTITNALQNPQSTNFFRCSFFRKK